MIPDHAVVTKYSSIEENEVADLEWSYHCVLSMMFSKGKKMTCQYDTKHCYQTKKKKILGIMRERNIDNCSYYPIQQRRSCL